ncbi:MAG: hypothetical protein IPK71_09250 [Myxococcales bacterium]|nr:hypothetical protein [Myxococcales bacterium]
MIGRHPVCARASGALFVLVGVGLGSTAGCSHRETKVVPEVLAEGGPGMAKAPPKIDTVEKPSPAPSATPFVSRCEGVTLVLTKVVVRDGYAFPVLELRNTGKSPVKLMATGDGSSEDMRNPSLAFTLSGKVYPPRRECGNVNGLAEEDLLTLAPGQTKVLEWVSPIAAEKGHHTLRATYRNDPESAVLRGVAPPADEALIARARATIPCQLTSNTLDFDMK